MVLLLNNGTEVANFGSHCRTHPTGQRVPCYFTYQEAYDCVKEVCQDGDAFVPGLSALAEHIIVAYRIEFEGKTDNDGHVRIPYNLC